MEIIYTLHAKEQMQERKIIPLWVEETIFRPDILRRDENKYFAVRKLNGKTLKVIYVKQKHIKVITSFFVQ